MKHSVIGLLWMLLVLTVAATCAGDTLGVYADNGGMNCNIVDNYTGLRLVYVVHMTDGATAVSFMAPKPVCWTGATYLWEVNQIAPCLGCGDSQTGMMIGYGSCRVGPIHILTIAYSVQGLSETCCLYPVLSHPSSPTGGIEVVDCYFNAGVAVGLVATVNGNATCLCGYPVLVEEMTWGRVKALYTE